MSEPQNVPTRARSNSHANSPKSWTDQRPKYIHPTRRSSKPAVPRVSPPETHQREMGMFESLPTELLIHILSHVDSKTLSWSIPLVNRRLYFISNDDGCWKTAFVRYFSSLPTRNLATQTWFGAGPWSWQKEYVARIRHLAAWGNGGVSLPNPYGDGAGQVIKHSKVGGVQFEARFGNDARGLGSVDRLSMVPLGNVLLVGCMERGLVGLADPVNGKLTNREVVTVHQGVNLPAESRLHLAASEDGQASLVSCMTMDATGFVAMGSPTGGVLVHYGHITQPTPNHPVFKTTLPNVALAHPRFTGSLPPTMHNVFQLAQPPHAPMATTALTWQMREKGTATHPSWLISGGGVNDGMVYLWNTSHLPASHAVACFSTHQPSDPAGVEVPGVASLFVDEPRGIVAAVLMHGRGLAVWHVHSWKQTMANSAQPLNAQPPDTILDWNSVFSTQADWNSVEIYALFDAGMLVVSSNLQQSGTKRRDVVSIAAVQLPSTVVWRGMNGHQDVYWTERSSATLAMPQSSRITSMAWDRAAGCGIARGKELQGASGGARVYADQVSQCGYGDQVPGKYTIVSGDEIGRISVWNMLSTQPVATYQLPIVKRAMQEYRTALKSDVTNSPPFQYFHPVLQLHVDAGKIVSSHADSCIRVRDVLTGSLLRELSTGNNRRWQDGEEHHSTPTCMFVTGSRVIVGTRGGSVKTWIAWGLERLGSWNFIPKKHAGAKKVSTPGAGPRGEAVLSLREHLEDHYDAVREGQRRSTRVARINGGFSLDQGWNDDELVKYVAMVSLEEERERQAILDVVRQSEHVVPRHMAINNRQHVTHVESDDDFDTDAPAPPPAEEFDPFSGPEQLGSSYPSSYGSSPTPVPFLQRRVAESGSSVGSDGAPRARRASERASEFTTMRFGSGAASGVASSPRIAGAWSHVGFARTTNEKVTSAQRRDADLDEELLYVLELSKVEM